MKKVKWGNVSLSAAFLLHAGRENMMALAKLLGPQYNANLLQYMVNAETLARRYQQEVARDHERRVKARQK